MHRLLRGPFAASLLVVVAASCSDPLAPAPVQGVYVLEAIDGHALPAHPLVDGRGPEVVADSLFFAVRLLPSGHGSFTRRFRNSGSAATGESTWEYTRQRDSLLFPLPPCDDTTFCFWSFPVGLLHGDTLTIHHENLNVRTLTYRRVR